MLVVLDYQTFVGMVQWVASQAFTMKNPLKNCLHVGRIFVKRF